MKKYLTGSYTIEAALIIPFIFTIIGVVFHFGIMMYLDIIEGAINIEIFEFDTIKAFRDIKVINQLLE